MWLLVFINFVNSSWRWLFMWFWALDGRLCTCMLLRRDGAYKGLVCYHCSLGGHRGPRLASTRPLVRVLERRCWGLASGRCNREVLIGGLKAATWLWFSSCAADGDLFLIRAIVAIYCDWEWLFLRCIRLLLQVVVWGADWELFWENGGFSSWRSQVLLLPAWLILLLLFKIVWGNCSALDRALLFY